jgi:hypothetical protein
VRDRFIGAPCFKTDVTHIFLSIIYVYKLMTRSLSEPLGLDADERQSSKISLVLG